MRVLNKKIWPYQIKLDNGDTEAFANRLRWLKENLYHGGYNDQTWYVNGDTYCFQNEKEYLHFRLVWE